MQAVQSAEIRWPVMGGMLFAQLAKMKLRIIDNGIILIWNANSSWECVRFPNSVFGTTQVLGVYHQLFVQQNEFNIGENVPHCHLLQLAVINPSLFTETVPQVTHQSISIHHRHHPRSFIQIGRSIISWSTSLSPVCHLSCVWRHPIVTIQAPFLANYLGC